MLNKLKNLMKDGLASEALRYIVFGVLTTLVNWLCYVALTGLFGLGGYETGSASYTALANLANGIAWVLSVLFAYVTNRRYVFKKSQRSVWQEMGLFFSSRALGYVLFDLLLFSLLIQVMDDKIAKLITNVLVVIYNYVASKWVVFRHRKEGDKADL